MGAPLHSLGMSQERTNSTMSSRKLLAFDFIKRYYSQWGQSPTLGEIGAALGGISSKRAYDLVHQLAVDRMIEVVSGKPRGIRLLDPGEELSEADVLVRLAAMGWTIGLGDRVIRPPIEPGQALTDHGLSQLPELDHDLGSDDGVGIHEERDQPQGKEDPRHAQ